MAATDTLKIDVVTTADLTGITQIQQALAQVNGEAVKSSAAIGASAAATGANVARTAETIKRTGDNVREGAKDVGELARIWNVIAGHTSLIERHLLNHATHSRAIGGIVAEIGGGWAAIITILVLATVKIFEMANEARKFREEVEKAGQEVLKTTEAWLRMAAAVKEATDVGGLARAIGTGLEDANAQLEIFTRKAADVSTVGRYWQSFVNLLVLSGDEVERLSNVSEGAADREAALAKKKVDALVQAGIAAKDAADETLRMVDNLNRDQATVDFLTRAIDALEKQIASLTITGYTDLVMWVALTTQLQNLRGVFNLVNNEFQRQEDFRKRIDQSTREANVLGNTEATIREKVLGAWQKTYDEAKKLGLEEDEAQARANQESFNEQRRLQFTEDNKDAHKDLNELLKEESALLESIRNKQSLISSNPIMSADAKQVALIREYEAEIVAIRAEMQKIASIKGGLTDPAQIEEANKRYQQLGFTLQQDQQKLFAALHPMRTELTAWVNAWGTASHQIATTIEDTIGQSLQALNNWIVTGKFNLQSFMQQIELLGLKLIEQLIMQQIMAAINAEASATLAKITGTQIAIAMAPAATATIIATEGAAALAAPGQFASALFSIEGLAAATAHEGGEIKRFHDGGLKTDERVIIGQTGEIVMRRSVAQANRDFLLALNAGHGRAYGFDAAIGASVNFRHNGGEIGRIGGGTLGGVHVYAFTDLKALTKHMGSRAGQKIIFDTVKGNRIDL